MKSPDQNANVAWARPSESIRVANRRFPARDHRAGTDWGVKRRIPALRHWARWVRTAGSTLRLLFAVLISVVPAHADAQFSGTVNFVALRVRFSDFDTNSRFTAADFRTNFISIV